MWRRGVHAPCKLDRGVDVLMGPSRLKRVAITTCFAPNWSISSTHATSWSSVGQAADLIDWQAFAQEWSPQFVTRPHLMQAASTQSFKPHRRKKEMATASVGASTCIHNDAVLTDLAPVQATVGLSTAPTGRSPRVACGHQLQSEIGPIRTDCPSASARTPQSASSR